MSWVVDQLLHSRLPPSNDLRSRSSARFESLTSRPPAASTCCLKIGSGVWQHLAAVRQDNTIRLYLNGQQLTPYDGAADVTVPGSAVPLNATRLRLGRRSSRNSDSQRFWQFYGLLDDVAVYTKALTASQIQACMAAASLTGEENNLLAGWTFDEGRQPTALARPVTLPTPAGVPEHVNPHAAHPVPAYYVAVSSNRDSAADSQKMDIRPSKVKATLPFGAGEWWRVSQGYEHPGSSHNGEAAFCWDFVRKNGDTPYATVLAATSGKVIFADDVSDNGEENAISVYHTSAERAVYMHLQKGCYGKYFGGTSGLPQDAGSTQPSYEARQPICEIGKWIEPDKEHLHFALGSIKGDTWGPDGANAGKSVPMTLVDYYVSTDGGTTWTHVPQGIPEIDEWVSRYPWSPWNYEDDNLTVAPAAASQYANSLDVFVQGENRHLWQKRWDGSAWSAWSQVDGGRLTSAPAAVSWGPQRIDVFVRGFKRHLAHKRWSAEHEWSEWRDLDRD